MRQARQAYETSKRAGGYLKGARQSYDLRGMRHDKLAGLVFIAAGLLLALAILLSVFNRGMKGEQHGRIDRSSQNESR